MIVASPRTRTRSPRISSRRSAIGISLCLGLLALVWTTAPVPAQTGPPVVVAVDTSRSLDAAALGEVVDRLRLALEDLPADTPTGLLAFDDSPRWVLEVGASAGDVAAALQQLDLQGSYTLLNDALFVATRDLQDGGVVLLATDGRDENSATTVDDIARRCEAQGVRILSVGTGRAVEERALRRLALLSSGRYLGDVRQVDAATVAEAVEEARDAVSAERAARTAPTTRAEPAPTPATSRPTGVQPMDAADRTGASRSAQAGESAASSWLRALLPWIITGLSILLVLVLVLSRRSASPRETDDDENPFADDAEDERAGDVAEAEVIRLELAQAEAAEPREAPEVTVDTTVFQQQMSLEDRLERTRVLSNNGVLLMRRMGESPRSFALDRHKAFAVGREKDKNTLVVPDPSISAHHFKIVPRGDLFFFVDLESTNGSYIGGRKVGAKRLRSGDVIRAGQVEFEFQNYSNV